MSALRCAAPSPGRSHRPWSTYQQPPAVLAWTRRGATGGRAELAAVHPFHRRCEPPPRKPAAPGDATALRPAPAPGAGLRVRGEPGEQAVGNAGTPPNPGNGAGDRPAAPRQPPRRRPGLTSDTNGVRPGGPTRVPGAPANRRLAPVAPPTAPTARPIGGTRPRRLLASDWLERAAGAGRSLCARSHLGWRPRSRRDCKGRRVAEDSRNHDVNQH